MSTDKYSKWIVLLTAILGLWIAATPFLWSIPETMHYSNMAGGLLIAVVAGFGAYRLFQDEQIHLAIPIIAAVIGLWMIVSPFAFGGVDQAVVASNVVAGILVLAISAYVVYIGRERGFATTGGAAI